MKLYLHSITFILLTLNAALCDEAVDKKELNDAMAERARLMVLEHQARERIEKAWADKKLTSPEIEKLRKRYQELTFEMVAVREKLKIEVGKLPEIQELARQAEEMSAKEKLLLEKIEKMQKK